MNTRTNPQAPLPGSLVAFFSAMVPFVQGKSDVSSVEARLGACPSGSARLALYPGLVRAQHVEALTTLHAPLRRALEHVRPGLFAAVVDGYLLGHGQRPRHPSFLAAQLAAFLCAYRAMRAHDLPAWAEELADFTYLRFELASARDAPGAPAPCEVRRYAHDVANWTLEALPGVPARQPTCVLVYRDARDARVHVKQATVADLAALALARGERSPEQLEALGLDAHSLASAQGNWRICGVVT